MEQLPPLPSREATPNIKEVEKPKGNLGSEIPAQISGNLPGEMQGSETEGDTERKLDVNVEPAKKWSMDSLSRISSGLGVPLYADECTTKVDKISFARVLLEMDVARELPKKLKVEDPNGRALNKK
ncbi:hypothetical protein H5410_022183 [Solanum commersonii]|uniref:Uncharacterized protein n=1 Tax=Solanum commersonii TaxID=4109 RepID=A0A9J5ZIX4_SOLCO|nr:hypothetical protein H5410_022183 [Solanum commersonii]